MHSIVDNIDKAIDCACSISVTVKVIPAANRHSWSGEQASTSAGDSPGGRQRACRSSYAVREQGGAACNCGRQLAGGKAVPQQHLCGRR